MKINEINEQTTNVQITARVERVVAMVSSTNSQYLIVHLADGYGRIEARLWGATENDKTNLKVGEIYDVAGQVNVYKSQLQLKITEFKILTEDELAKKGIKKTDFMISAPLDIATNFKKMVDIVSDVQNEVYRKITLGLLQQFEIKFTTYPAAISIHHNVVGGLFWHSYSLLINAISIRQVYDGYADIDWDLVYCGAILHDIGKIKEMNGVSADDYTFEGKMLGHISMGSEMVGIKANELGYGPDSEGVKNPDVVKLQHVILSSHGKREFGSPQEPSLLEGIIISTFDNLDARIFRINDELTKVEMNKWTPRVMNEDGKMFFRHFKNKKIK